MKVLMIIDRMMVGGAEQVFEDLIILMKKHVNLTALTICDSEPNQIERISKNVPTIELGRQNKYSISSLLRCRKILSNYDVLHVHLRHTYRYLALVKKVFNLSNPIIFHDHYGQIEVDRSKPFRFANFFKPDFYVGVSESLCTWSVEKWNLENNRTKCLINLPKVNFKYYKEPIQPQNNLLIVGNIKPIKNQSFALQFAQKVNEKIHLVGKIQDDNYYLDFSDTKGYKLRTNINAASEVLCDYKFGLCTSISESGPLVVLEYFIAGLPFLAHKTGGIAEILSKYVPQYFIDNLDLDVWIQRYDQLNEKYERIPQGLIDEVLEKEFNRENYAHQLIKIYKQCRKNS